MLEKASKEAPEAKTKLVLGFDGGCGTCLELAQRIHEQVGQKIDVTNLRDPQVQAWRKRALGEDAPWAPTLFEVRGEKVRAWTGWRMGMFLTRYLGARDTWKVMQAVGEMNAPPQQEAEETPDVKVVGGLSRGQFLKGVGGAALAMSVLAGTGRLASPAMAAPTSVTQIKGKELVDVARRMAGRADTVNVGGQKWSNGMRSNRVATSCQNGKCMTAISGNEGGCSISWVNGQPRFSGDCNVIIAGAHRYEDGTKMTAVSYASTKSDRVIVYYEYEKAGRRTKSVAKVWRPEGKKAILVGTPSHNGELDRPVPRSNASRVDATVAGDPCGGCDSVAPGARYLGQGCQVVSPWSCGYALAGCGFSVAGCILSAPTLVLNAICVGALLTSCPAVVATCCGEYQPACAFCGPVR